MEPGAGDPAHFADEQSAGVSFTTPAAHRAIAPFSAIKELEDDLGAQLFERDRSGTRLTRTGAVFLEDVRRLFSTLEQARENVKAISAGYRGSLLRYPTAP